MKIEKFWGQLFVTLSIYKPSFEWNHVRSHKKFSSVGLTFIGNRQTDEQEYV